MIRKSGNWFSEKIMRQEKRNRPGLRRTGVMHSALSTDYQRWRQTRSQWQVRISLTRRHTLILRQMRADCSINELALAAWLMPAPMLAADAPVAPAKPRPSASNADNTIIRI
jgi:hypothetical protein